MRLNKANMAGLTSPGQQSEMKSILAGTWPPFKPLPVFKYETDEYRATIAFDRKRGEWVCRKTSLPSNQVQELRGGLREITMALPHGEAEMFTEEAERPEQELEKDTNRRLQALHDWRENHKNGALYFELREYLSENQRTELDDSLRLSLTARQLQFNSKNVATVFDDLSIAGGRFATLIEFAKRNKASQGIHPQAQGEEALPKAESAIDINHGKQSLRISSPELEPAPISIDLFVRDQEAEERSASAEEFPALSIKDVFPDQDQVSLAEQVAHARSQQFETEVREIVDANSPSLVENPPQERHRSPAFSDPAAPVRTAQSPADRTEGSSSRFPALEISAFQVALFALLFLFAAIAFTVGLTVGHRTLGKRLGEAPKSMLASNAKSPTPTDRSYGSTSRTATPPMASSDDLVANNRLDDATRSDENSKESIRGSEYFATVRSTDSDVRKMLPPARPSTILVAVPGRGQPFRVSSPRKAIVATSSFAMTSQLSLLVSPESGPTVAHNPARLEGGELVSFVWPRYARPGTIRVRATTGQLGQVLEVKFLSGSVSLLPATMRAIRQWRYRPTLLDTRPVQAQQDVTIEFRPPQYSSHLATRHSFQN